jgi:hypothetical protein
MTLCHSELSPDPGRRISREALLTRTPEGEHLFWLSVPVVGGPKPQAEARVLAPPGEMGLLWSNAQKNAKSSPILS